MKRIWIFLAIAFLATMTNRRAVAATNGFLVPPFRGLANSEAGYWEVFTSASGAAGNRADRPGSTSRAVLVQMETNAILTGTGNIYNPAGTNSFKVSDAPPFAVGTVVLQTRGLGNEIDYSSMTLRAEAAGGAQLLLPAWTVELSRGSQPGLGVTVSMLWQWDLTGLNVTNYAIEFRAAGSSLSFDAMTLDTAAEFAPLFTPRFEASDAAPAIERWMYPHNASPCDRSAGSVFGTLSDESGVDSRHAQHLIGWDTGSIVATNRDLASYLITRCRVTLTINRGNLFVLDPTADSFRTYLPTNHPAYLADADAGRPVELFGAGFRNGYTAATFDQCAPFGPSGLGERNAYAAGWSTNGVLIDIGNHVGKTNENFPPFEVVPFAVGQSTNALAGELVPAGAKITFDLNLADPFVLGYLREGLKSGFLRFMVTSLHTSGGQAGSPSYPDFVTHFNAAAIEPTRLEISGLLAGEGDRDADQLPDDWELFHLNTLTHAGSSDPDSDNVQNASEFAAGTRPATFASAPLLERIARSGEEVTLVLTHEANRRYRIEFSDNLTTWTPLGQGLTFDLFTGKAFAVDRSASRNRFYRVASESAE